MTDEEVRGDYLTTALETAIKALEQKKRVETALEAVEETRKWMKTAWGIDAPLEPIITAIKALEETDKIDESDFSSEQYEADLQAAYDCGYNCGYADAMNDIAER